LVVAVRLAAAVRRAAAVRLVVAVWLAVACGWRLGRQPRPIDGRL
jgi:hypothetical protein